MAADYPRSSIWRRWSPGAGVGRRPGRVLTATPIRLRHGKTDALGLRFGAVAYTPDLNTTSIQSRFRRLRTSISGSWMRCGQRRIPTHFSLQDALRWIERLKPRRAVLTNLHTDLDYASLSATLRRTSCRL